jgi:hypothetical protein
MTGPGGLRGPGNPRPAVRRTMSTGWGIFLVALGAILVFALHSGSPHWLNLKVVGIILILAGLLGMTLPRLKQRGGSPPGLMRRWLMPGQFQSAGERANGQEPANDDGRLLVRDYSDDDPPTLADEVLSLEHDPPL